jgi:hypothetical protein
VTDPTDPGVDPVAPTIEVFAAGTGGPRIGPTFEVYADGIRLGSAFIDNPVTLEEKRAGDFTWERFTFTYEADVPSTVEVRFVNDGTESGGVDRNLLVDKIIVAGREFKTIFDGVYIPSSSSNIVTGGPGNEAFWNGTFIYDTSAGDAGSGGVLRVLAAGTGSGDDAPSFTVKVNGVAVANATISTPITNSVRRSGDFTWETFDFVVQESTPSRIEIVYANDRAAANGEDLNLMVDKIILNGKVYEAEVDGFYTPENPERWDRAASTSFMAWNGEMVFDLS